jgi:hypothetical protein
MSKGRLAGAAVALALMGAVAAGCTTASQARPGGPLLSDHRSQTRQ